MKQQSDGTNVKVLGKSSDAVSNPEKQLSAEEQQILVKIQSFHQKLSDVAAIQRTANEGIMLLQNMYNDLLITIAPKLPKILKVEPKNTPKFSE